MVVCITSHLHNNNVLNENLLDKIVEMSKVG